MESQCVGLAEAMGFHPVVKRVRLRKLWRALSPYLNWGKRISFSGKGDLLKAPWPDIVIASGRLSVLPSLYVKEITGGKSFHIQIQDPAFWYERFDAVIVPEHDKLGGVNTIATKGAMHRVQADLLAREGKKWAPVFAHLPRPYTAVILGGSNGVYKFGPHEAVQLAARLEKICKTQKTSLLITPSRRTGEPAMVILKALLHDCPAYIWDGKGENPYYGMLALADHFVVTCDSVNMISEAASTGKPVHVVRLPGASDKFEAFHESLIASGNIRFMGEELEDWTVQPLNEMARVAEVLRQAIEKKLA